MCIKEGLRLYSPVHAIQRELTQDLLVEGMTVPKGQQLLEHTARKLKHFNGLCNAIALQTICAADEVMIALVLTILYHACHLCKQADSDHFVILSDTFSLKHFCIFDLQCPQPSLEYLVLSNFQ